MTKEALVLLVLVGGAAVGIVYAIGRASSNDADWAEYERIRLGESYGAVRAKFGTVSDDLRTLTDARAANCASAFKELVEAGGTRMIVVPSRDDAFYFGFDKGDKLIYKNFRRY